MRYFRTLLLVFSILAAEILITGCAGSAGNPATNQSTVFSASTPPPVTADVPSIDIRNGYTLMQKNENNPNFVILDVRTPDEFNTGHLANAVNIDYYSPDFKSSISKLDRNKEYLIYCKTGIRSASATRTMLDLGFTSVLSLTGGIMEWTSAGYPTLK
jgi:rhodanese-related sulfurtransferase